MTDKLDSTHSKNPPSKKGEEGSDTSLTMLPSKNSDNHMGNSANESASGFTDNYRGDSSKDPLNNLMGGPKTHPEDEQSDIPPDILRIDEKIHALKKKKERIQTQKALLFMKETQKIFNESMSPNLALLILTEAWTKASHSQKEEWQKRARSFRVSPPQQIGNKTPKADSASHQSSSTKVQDNEYPRD